MRSILHSQLSERPDVLAHLGENLRRLRTGRAFSQSELAERADLSRRMISSIEGGAANVSLSTVDRLAAALAVKFTDLVRPPGAENALHIESVGWRGQSKDSEGVLLGAAPGSRESELWRWSLAPGERYDSEEGSENWHEMLYVLEGRLTLETSDGVRQMDAGDFLIFSSAAPYVFVNQSDAQVRYIRSVVL